MVIAHCGTRNVVWRGGINNHCVEKSMCTFTNEYLVEIILFLPFYFVSVKKTKKTKKNYCNNKNLTMIEIFFKESSIFYLFTYT